ncbi:hypothetical protein [Polyangium aurulentum]|uniref:hypothetical protein n=1 Tax=Polyangium aurulentum TaxID=2567896 RepID=UPI0010ADCE02|nr:hypothetical protein [Polyangium aurulentum]UQA56668.1 hypothetical protein E8A73_035990 [Polyangium aurulentum]
MPRRPRPRAPRAALAAICLLASAASCTRTAPPATTATNEVRCDEDTLAPCERAMAGASGNEARLRELLGRYVEARAAKDPRDPWPEVWKAMAAQGGPKALVLLEASGAERAPIDPKTARSVRTSSLPPPVEISREALLVAMGEAAGIDVIARVRGPENEVTEIFPRDPLRPFLAGIAPVIRASKGVERIADDLALAAAVRRAAAHAAAFRYVEAAKEADALAALVAARDPHAEPTLRARYLLALLEGAGIALEPAAPVIRAARPEEPSPPASLAGTPYGDLLRVRTARDERAAWEALGKRILAAVPEKRREAFSALFRSPEACSPVPPPPMEGVGDLVFASTLAGALSPEILPGETSKHENLLPLTAWLERYGALVRAADGAGTAWAHAPALVQERGEIAGIRLASTPAHRRVTALVEAHLAALGKLEAAFPDRFRALALVPLIYARGLLADEPLRSALGSLLERAVADRLARAEGARGVFEAAITGALAGSAYPEPIQSAYYGALLRAFSDKLRKDLGKQEGWGVAGLFAAEATLRLATGGGPDLGAAADEISRALADPALAYAPAARLARSAARYAALAHARKLEPDADPARLPAERKAARDGLREAIAGLSDGGGQISAGLAEDVANLGDGTLAALVATALDKPAAAQPACEDAASGPSPAVQRSLVRLGALRRKILASPAYKKGDTVALRLVRLLVTLLSDALDLAARPRGKRAAFVVPAAGAERAAREALEGWDERAAADALGALYGLVRAYFGAEKPGAAGADRAGIARLIAAGAALFREGDKGGVALLDALARAEGSRPTGEGIGSLLVAYARSLHALGKRDQADLCFLGVMLASIVADRPPPDDAVALADEQKSPLAFALRFAREVRRARGGASPDPSTYASSMREAMTRACQDPAPADRVLGVMDAIRKAQGGNRGEARAALDAFLARAESEGLDLPRMSYRYEERTTSKVFNVSLDVSFGAGLLEGSSTFQIGLGVRSPGEPSGALTARLAPADDPESEGEAARYYLHTAAVAAAYHFLDGDGARGAADAAKAVEVAVRGVRLGPRAHVRPDPVAWAQDARGTLALTAVLAAEAGMPLLAGDLWTVVRGAIPPDASDEAIAEILGKPPLALAGDPKARAPLDRASRALTVLAEPLACTDAKADTAALSTPSCDAYPLALSLRAGGSLKKLPRLPRACQGPLVALDAFLGGLETKTYDPDAFTRAVVELRAADKPYEAAVLLVRQRQRTHCNPTLLSAARALGRTPSLGPSLRADLLSVAVQCAPPGAGMLDDLAALDAETARLPDRTRNLSLLVFAAELGVQRERWDALGRLAKSPAFVQRWLDAGPRAVLLALLLRQAAAVLNGERRALGADEPTFTLFCRTLPPGDAAGACAAIEALGKPSVQGEEARKIARQAVIDALAGVAKDRSVR